MTAVRDDSKTTRSKPTEAAQQALIERVSARFPELSRDDIAKSVRGEYDGYATSPIQDFVPILVERTVATDLRRSTPMHRA